MLRHDVASAIKFADMITFAARLSMPMVSNMITHHHIREDCAMSAQHDWPLRASRYLKAELKRQGITYDDLAARLNEMGFVETKASIANKVSRGAFTAAFFLASLRAAGTQTLRVEDL